MINILKKALGNSRIWKLFNSIITYPDAFPRFIDQYVTPESGMVIADLGCGTAEVLGFLPGDVTYYGIDSNPSYIDACRQRYGSRGNFLCIEIGKVDSLPVNVDAVLVLGVLHHLTDDEARHLAKLAYNSLKPGGRLITLDGCFRENQSWFERWLLRSDRGKFVRNGKGYKSIVATHFSDIRQDVVKAYMKLPYTHNIMVCRK